MLRFVKINASEGFLALKCTLQHILWSFIKCFLIHTVQYTYCNANSTFKLDTQSKERFLSISFSYIWRRLVVVFITTGKNVVEKECSAVFCRSQYTNWVAWNLFIVTLMMLRLKFEWSPVGIHLFQNCLLIPHWYNNKLYGQHTTSLHTPQNFLHIFCFQNKQHRKLTYTVEKFWTLCLLKLFIHYDFHVILVRPLLFPLYSIYKFDKLKWENCFIYALNRTFYTHIHPF